VTKKGCLIIKMIFFDLRELIEADHREKISSSLEPTAEDFVTGRFGRDGLLEEHVKKGIKR